jgi:ElaB/YqjD/DUF883 family membrane-anchored ribosome-binding protein
LFSRKNRLIFEGESHDGRRITMAEKSEDRKFDDKRIDEALQLLNDVAREKKAELRDMVSRKYTDLKSALGGTAEKMQDQAEKTYAEGKEKVIELASAVDITVHKNPWPYLGGTALGFLVLGFIFGRSRKS